MKPEESEESRNNLPPGETDRHIPLDALKVWSARLRSIVESLLDALHHTDPQFKIAAIMNAKVTADFLRDDIQGCIGEEDPTHSSGGLQEDNERLKQDKYLLRAYLKAWEKREFSDEKDPNREENK